MSRYIGIQEKCTSGSVANSKWPENICESDKYLFKNTYKRQVPDSNNYKYNNVQLNSDLIHIHKGDLFTGLNAFLQILKFKPLFHKFIFIRRRIASICLFNRKHKYINLDKAILITGQWSHEYAHWFCESLPRLFTMHGKASGMHLLLPAKYKKYNYIVDSLRFFDVNVLYYDRPETFIVNELHVPHYLLLTGDFCKSNMREMAKFIFSNLSISTNEKAVKRLYISRQHAKRRKVVNEDEVIKLVKEYGFQVLYAEKLTFKEQLSIYRNVEMLVSLHGAGLTNMIFLPFGCNVLELRRHGDALNNIFYSLADTMGHNYYYQECKSRYDNPITWCADLVVDIERLESNLNLIGAVKDINGDD